MIKLPLRLLIALFLFCNFPLSAEDSRPNVLFIAIDDLNDWVGCYGGHPQVKTPNIDRLAKRGVLFKNAQCQAPICNPSRASLTTGLLPSTTGIYFLQPGARHVERTRNADTLFQHFGKQGYYTATRGKIFHGKINEIEKASFDEYSNATGGAPRPKKGLSRNKTARPGSWDWGAWYEKDEDLRDYRTAKWAAERLGKLAEKEKPFFMALGFSLPHVPLYVPQKWFDMYPRDKVILPVTSKNDLDGISKYAISLTHSGVAPRHSWMVENGEFAHAVQAYLACISFVDHCVGIALDGLDQSGAEENTVVVLWSDHGFHLGEKERWAKRSLWEESARSPLIFAGPGCKEDVHCARPVGLIDIYPTLVDLCGLPEKSDLEGISIRPLLENPMAKWEKPALTTFGPDNHSLRSERWRYIIYSDGSEELYDHKNDPDERTNLASLPEHESVIADLSRWLPKVNVPVAPGSTGSGTPLYPDLKK